MESERLGDRATCHSFQQFSELDEEMMMHILSFIAEAPLEKADSRPLGTITGVLPLVNKQFNEFCKRDYFWQAALKRVCVREPSLWEEGLLRLLPQGTKSFEGLVDYAHERLAGSTYHSIFRNIFQTYIRFTGPVFYMTGAVRLGQPFGLHFFEPRYRLLIAEVMQDWPESARRGESIVASSRGLLPTFIYAHMSPLAPKTPACLVQVRNCMIHPDGSADVMLTPVAYVSLEQVWERPNSRGLFEASCLRMGRLQTLQIERQVSGTAENAFHQFTVNGEGIDIHSRGALHAIISHLLAAEEQD